MECPATLKSEALRADAIWNAKKYKHFTLFLS